MGTEDAGTIAGTDEGAATGMVPEAEPATVDELITGVVVTCSIPGAANNFSKPKTPQ